MRRFAVAMCMFVIALVGASGVASARPAMADGSAAVANCQHSGGDGVIVSAAYVRRHDGQVNLGAVQLCRNASSPYYWAYVVFYDPVPTGNWGQAFLNRYYAGERSIFDCDDSGGNKYVQRGQTMCWTPKIYAPSSNVTFMAAGIQCEGAGPGNCTFRQGAGFTAQTR